MDDQIPLIDIQIYTARVLVRGQVQLPYRRALDLLNSDDRDYLSIERATVAPLAMPGQVTGPNAGVTVVQRRNVLLAGVDTAQAAPLASDTAATRLVRYPCLGFLGPFVFHAQIAHLPTQRLVDVLETQRSSFMSLYDATVYLVERPDLAPQSYPGLVINLGALELFYML